MRKEQQKLTRFYVLCVNLLETKICFLSKGMNFWSMLWEVNDQNIKEETRAFYAVSSTIHSTITKTIYYWLHKPKNVGELAQSKT